MNISQSQKEPVIQLKPIISYPRTAKVGEQYLLSIDVQVADNSPWPYEEEEVEISCLLRLSPFFTYEPLGEYEPILVLHRFGGTYGPAEYLLTASQKEVPLGEMMVVLLNGWGLPIAQIPLKCEVKQEVVPSKKRRPVRNVNVKPEVPVAVSREQRLRERIEQ